MYDEVSVVLDLYAVQLAGFTVLIILIAGLRPYRGGWFAFVWAAAFIGLALVLGELFNWGLGE